MDLESAWNRADLLTDSERHILTELFRNGLSASTLSAETGQPAPMLYSLMHSGLEKLRDDLNGYTTEPEPFNPPETVPDSSDSLLTDYEDDSGEPYVWLTRKQLKHRQMTEVSYEDHRIKQYE